MSQQLQITGGAKVRDLNDVIIGTSGVLSSLAFNVANGVPKLDSNAKILVSQLPNSVMEYLGTWNAATNTPFLVNGTGNAGDVYLCNVAGTVDFGAGPISFVVSDQVIYSGSIWQKASGSNGTVTSIGLSSTGNDAITITGSPVTTSGTINLGFAGTNLQYINGAGDLTTFPTLISSIGLSMPSAFSVANSPLTSNGTIAVTGAGYPSQYIRGDGTLADFPTSGGGGSSVSYYLNGGTSQGTIGGVTYYEMSKTADTGTGVDFPKTGDGFIVAFLTDAGDPAQLNIPAGNWNYEIYASMSANGGTPEMYAELYKYDGTTFTLIATSPHEILYDGTALNLYTFAMTVPSTTLAITDRLAVKLYATNSGGKTTTVHTQDSHLCQIITTFSTGITALNGLTAQVQYFGTGTSGTDFNISSTTATHTFNLPVASAANTGKLSSTDWSTFNGKVPYTGATTNVNLGGFGLTASAINVGNIVSDGNIILKKVGLSVSTPLYVTQFAATTGVGIGYSDGTGGANFILQTAAIYDYTFPAATGTIALTSNLSAYLPLTGGTLTGNLTGTTAIFNGSVDVVNGQINLSNSYYLTARNNANTSYISLIGRNPSDKVVIDASGNGTILSGTLAVTGAATFSSSVGVGGATNTLGFLEVWKSGGAIAQFSIGQNATYHTDFFVDTTGNFYIQPQGNTRLTILSGGNVGIGTSNPNAKLSLGNTTSSAKLLLYDGGFTGSGGNGYFAGFAIDSPSANDTTLLAHYQGALVFGRYTNANDTSAITERMRINSSGNVGIGITTGTINGRLCVEGAGASGSNIHLEFLTDTNRSYIQSANRTFIANAPLTIESSSITLVALGTGNVYSTGGVLSVISDMNVKIEDGYLDSALEKVLKLKPRYFLWKEESGLPTNLRQLGFYAQEVNAALGEEAANTPKENEYFGINDRAIIAYLAKAIQEQQVQIEELKSLINK